MRKILHKRKSSIILSFLLSMLFVLAFSIPASAATPEYKIPSSTKCSLGTSAAYIKLGQSNLKSLTYNTSYFYEVSGNPKYLRAYARTANWSLTNPINMEFVNCGTIDGRSLNATVHYDSFKAALYNGYAWSTTATGRPSVLELWGTQYQHSSYKESSSYTYRAQHTSRVTVTITYADTGEVVDKPFYMVIYDLDTYQNTANVGESFQPVAGYKSIYTYNNCNLAKSSAQKYYAKAQAPVDGNASYTAQGLVAVTNNGQFTYEQDVANAATGIEIYCEFTDAKLPDPVESFSKTEYVAGEPIELSTSQKVGTFYQDNLTYYEDMSLHVDVPEKLTYKSAKIVNSSGADVSDMGNLSYDSAARKVSFDFTKSKLQSQSFYNGSTYSLQVECEPVDSCEGSFESTGYSVISGVRAYSKARTEITHDWEDDFTTDVEPTCTEDGSKSIHCKVCDEKKDITEIPALGHSFTKYQSNNDATCIDDGTETAKCDRCDVTDTRTEEDSAIGHDWEEEWTVDNEPTCTLEGSKSIHCKVCDEKKDITEIPALGHDMSEWETVQSPNCVDKGSSHRHCQRDNCEHEEYKDIDPNGHTWSQEWTIDKEPTCIEDGSKSHHCTVCDVKTDITVIPALGHDMGDWHVTKKPTCIEEGEERCDCNRCDYYELKPIDALGHDYSNEWTIDKEPTCTLEGSRSHHCTRCDESNDSEVIPTLGHDMSEWHITKEPAIGVKGEKQRECLRDGCEYKEVMELPALEDPSSVDTGDEENLLLWFIGLIASIFTGAFFFEKRRNI